MPHVTVEPGAARAAVHDAIAAVAWAFVRPPGSPLFEKERDAVHVALVAQLADPVGMHGTRLRPAVSAADDPIESSARFIVVPHDFAILIGTAIVGAITLKRVG